MFSSIDSEKFSERKTVTLCSHSLILLRLHLNNAYNKFRLESRHERCYRSACNI